MKKIFYVIGIMFTMFLFSSTVHAEVQTVVLDSRSDPVPDLSWTSTGHSELFWNIVDFSSDVDGVLIFTFAYRPGSVVLSAVNLYSWQYNLPIACDISSIASFDDSSSAIATITAICPIESGKSYYQVGFAGSYKSSSHYYLGKFGSLTDYGVVNGSSGTSTDYTTILNTINNNISNINSYLQQWQYSIPNMDNSISTIKTMLQDYFANNPTGIMSSIEDNTADISTNTEAINDSINSDNTSGAESSAESFVDDPAFDDSTGLSAIISMPLTFVNTLSSSCSPISLTIPYMNYQFQLPCIQSIVNHYAPALVVVIKVIVNGLIIYWVMLDIFKIVKNAKNPDDDRIEVLDL